MANTAINSSAAGSITSLTDTSYSGARGASTGTVSTSAQQANAVRFLKGASRGGATYSISRYFVKFDTSGISTNVTAATITIKSFSTSFMAPSTTVMKSTGFTNNGALTGTDFATVNFSTAFLAFDNAAFDIANVTSEDAQSIASKPAIACCTKFKFVFVLSPHVPEFSPVTISSSFKSVE